MYGSISAAVCVCIYFYVPPFFSKKIDVLYVPVGCLPCTTISFPEHSHEKLKLCVWVLTTRFISSVELVSELEKCRPGVWHGLIVDQTTRVSDDRMVFDSKHGARSISIADPMYKATTQLR